MCGVVKRDSCPGSKNIPPASLNLAGGVSRVHSPSDLPRGVFSARARASDIRGLVLIFPPRLATLENRVFLQLALLIPSPHPHYAEGYLEYHIGRW
ncbi:unnamed protein product [Parascedosporium putredinis]|uniref:Uncharacterized protein n=1 Tax=Parascedosporium putredinis TaxID=1442378 RepID=A0A9P1GTF2_9PEZI|nr:unnamed protein product [Parascedosporium putredinis]CAI7987307.1 unnamed protein product [Parascedosporium putredinis]